MEYFIKVVAILQFSHENLLQFCEVTQ